MKEEPLRCAGSQFDPRVVSAFLNVLQAESRDEPAKQAA
jgi:hypothetical protein